MRKRPAALTSNPVKKRIAWQARPLGHLTGAPPYHVSAYGYTGGAGTQEDPVTVEGAQRLLLDFCHRVMDCEGGAPMLSEMFEEPVCIVACESPSCELLACDAGRCSRRVCAKHGTGRGYILSWAYGGIPEILFGACTRRHKGCMRAFCERHWDRVTLAEMA